MFRNAIKVLGKNGVRNEVALPFPAVREADPRYIEFKNDLLQLKFPQDRVFDDPLRTLVYGTDASFYRLVPRVVVHVESEDEVIKYRIVALTHELTPFEGTEFSAAIENSCYFSRGGHFALGTSCN